MSERTRIKICGITRAEDAARASALGADALGMVFVPASARHVDLDDALRLRAEIPPFVQLVALFMDADAEQVRTVCKHLKPDLLQFHGSESADFCRGFGRPYIKSVAAGAGVDLIAAEAAYPDAVGLLVDGHDEGEMGGSGRSVQAELVSGSTRLPVILAGGLSPGNVAAAITAFQPWAVDVSSGVESAPGVKSPERMAAFIEEVRKADEQRSRQL